MNFNQVCDGLISVSSYVNHLVVIVCGVILLLSSYVVECLWGEILGAMVN